jgi:hypothetical protein
MLFKTVTKTPDPQNVHVPNCTGPSGKIRPARVWKWNVKRGGKENKK